MNEIIRHIGDITDLQEGVIIHGCNAQGVMGSGVAKALRDKYSRIFVDYKNLVDSVRTKSNALGRVAITEVRPKKLFVANAITQLEYGTDKTKVYVDYASIGRAFSEAGRYASHYKLDIHFPLIGCGLANGDWATVEEIINRSTPKGVRKHLWELQ